MTNTIFRDVAITKDGILASGVYLNSYNAVEKNVLTMYDREGEIAWMREIDSESKCHSTTDGNCLFSSTKGHDISIRMLDPAGTMLTNVVLDIPGVKHTSKVCGDFIYDLCNEGDIACISKVGLDGKTHWRSYVNNIDNPLLLNDLAVSKDGSIYAVGVMTEDNGDRPFIVKFSETGKQMWYRIMESEGEFEHVATHGKHVFAVGCEHVLTKWDSDGRFIWSQGVRDGYFAGNISVDVDGSVYVTYRKDAHSYLSKRSEDGDLVWVKRIENGRDYRSLVTSMLVSHGDVYTVGVELYKNNKTQGVLNRWNQDGMLEWSEHLA